MEPTTLLPIISVLLLVSVEYGGWSLLGFLTGGGQLGEFREQFFRAGHAHAPETKEPNSMIYLAYVGGLLVLGVSLIRGVGRRASPLNHP